MLRSNKGTQTQRNVVDKEGPRGVCRGPSFRGNAVSHRGFTLYLYGLQKRYGPQKPCGLQKRRACAKDNLGREVQKAGEKINSPARSAGLRCFLERATGLGPANTSLGSWGLTTWRRPLIRRYLQAPRVSARHYNPEISSLKKNQPTLHPPLQVPRRPS